MYLPIDPQPTSAQGWLNTALTVQTGGGEAHNVVIDIADPLAESETDAAIIREVDAFLRGHHRNSLSGVANTIFPQSTYDRHGPEAFYGVYRDTVLPRMKQMTRDWGRYFDRLTAWKKVRGSEVTMINPLDDLVKFMTAQVASDRHIPKRLRNDGVRSGPRRWQGLEPAVPELPQLQAHRREPASPHCHVSQSRLHRARARQLYWPRPIDGLRLRTIGRDYGLAHVHLNAC